jgi:hypothetical protein
MAMVAGGAYAVHKHNENQEQEQEQQQVDEAAPVPAGEAPAQEAGAVSGDDVSQLTELKGLLDSGVLTQAEFDAEKHKILGI